jgi:hypothetical protein
MIAVFFNFFARGNLLFILIIIPLAPALPPPGAEGALRYLTCTGNFTMIVYRKFSTIATG